MKIPGLMNERDRHWKVILPDGTVGGLTDYNWEITGSTANLPMLTYGGNAYYWTTELQRRGYTVIKLDRSEWGIMTGCVLRATLITREYVRANPTMMFVFGDNMARRGYGGQAKAMRNEPNAIGVPTKWTPSLEDAAYFYDADWDQLMVRDAIMRAFQQIENALTLGHDVVIPSDGLGTGLADLPKRGPRIFEYIEKRIKALENNALLVYRS